jgi:hypothetical protein
MGSPLADGFAAADRGEVGAEGIVAEPEAKQVRHAAAREGCAREAVDIVGVVLDGARGALLDPDPGDPTLVEGEASGPQGLPARIVDLAPEPGRLAVLVEGDALDGTGVGRQGDVAVEGRPQAHALDREDDGLDLFAGRLHQVDEGVLGNSHDPGGVLRRRAAARRIGGGLALVVAVSVHLVVGVASAVDLDHPGFDALVEDPGDLLGGELLPLLQEARHGENLGLAVQQDVCVLAVLQEHRGARHEDRAHETDGRREADDVARTMLHSGRPSA